MARRSADAEGLEALLSGDLSEDAAPSSLVRLAGLATAVREHTELESPTDEFRTRLRAELLAAPASPSLLDRARDRVEATTARLRHSARVAGAAAVASSMLGTTAVAAASQSALPGDLLYGVKGFTEDARMALASGDVARGQLHLAFARERLDELEAGRDTLAPDELTATLDALDTEAAQGADQLLAAAAQDATQQDLLVELDDFTAEVRARLQALALDLPLSVQPATERTLEVLRRIDVQVSGLLASAGCEVCETTGGLLPRIVLPGEGPAVPSCLCVDGAVSRVGDAGETAGDVPTETLTEPGPAPAESPQIAPTPSPGTGQSSGEDGGLGTVVGEVTEPLDDVGSIVDDVLDPSLGSDGGGVGEVVDDATSELDDAASELDDAVGDLGTATNDLGSTVEDTVSDVGTTVDDTVSELDDTVEDVTGSVTDQLGDGLLD